MQQRDTDHIVAESNVCYNIISKHMPKQINVDNIKLKDELLNMESNIAYHGFTKQVSSQ